MVRDINKNGNFESDEIFYYVKNHLNSVTELLDHNGDIYQRYTYLAYGETKIAKHNPNLELIPNRYAYTSREIDEHTGLYYYRARWYDPHAGRFVSEDPIGFDGDDSNLYRYVVNNLLILVDPSGMLMCPMGPKVSSPPTISDPPIQPVYPVLNLILFKGTTKIGSALNKVKNSNRYLRIGKGKFPSSGSKRLSIGGTKGKKLEIGISPKGKVKVKIGNKKYNIKKGQ